MSGFDPRAGTPDNVPGPEDLHEFETELDLEAQHPQRL